MRGKMKSLNIDPTVTSSIDLVSYSGKSSWSTLTLYIW